jgi:hypothetical protein
MKKTIFTALLLTSLTTCTIKQDGGSNYGMEKTISQSEGSDEDSLTNRISKEESLLETETKASLPVVSGKYNNGVLSLAHDGQLVSGYYANGRYAGNPNFGCSFYFYGRSNDQIDFRKIKIVIINPFNLLEKLREGTLKIHDEEDIFSLVADLNANDCWDQELGFVEIGKDPGIGFVLSEEKPWLEIRVAASERVYFHDSTAVGEKRQAYVIKGDPLFISKVQGEWLLATFIGQKSEVNGWVKRADTKGLPELAER